MPDVFIQGVEQLLETKRLVTRLAGGITMENAREGQHGGFHL